MQDDLATTTQTKLLTRSRLETLLIRAAPYLPLLAAILLFAGSLMTWVTVRFSFFTDSLDLSSTNSFDMAIMGWSGLLGLIDQTPFIALARLTLFLWDVFPLAGILLGLILMRQRRVTRPPLTLYGAWLLITTLVFALILAHGLTMTSPFPCAPGAPVCPQTWVVSRGIEAGGWLTLGSLALSWLALGLLIQRQRTSAVIATPPGVDLVSLTSLTPALRYPPSHRLGAVIFTAGAALWAFGLFAVPWATSHCTGLHLSFNHFVRGACGGVDGFDVLSAGLAVSGQNSVISWPLIEFAGITGLFVVTTIWLPRLTRGTWVTALGWLLLASLLAFIGMRGIQATIANPPRFTYDMQGEWVGSYGAAICALGVIVCLAGAALLARAEIVQARQMKGAGRS